MEKYWIEISDIAKHDIRGIGKYIINEFKEPIVAANIGCNSGCDFYTFGDARQNCSSKR